MTDRNAEDNYEFLTQGPIPKVVMTMAVPTIISMMITSLYNIVDTFFVGLIDTQSIAAVGISFSVMFFIQALSFFFGMGSGSYISRELGAGRRENAETMASTALGYTVMTALIITVLGYIFTPQLAVLLGSTPTIAPYAESYLSISFLGTPMTMAAFCMNNHMRFEGYARYAMWGIASGAILNCVLDPIFIFALDMGVSGAAIASVVGQSVGVIVMWKMTKREGVIRYSVKNFRHSAAYVKEIVAGGTPSVSRQGLAAVSTAMLNVAAGAFGDAAIAAMSIVTRVTTLFFSAMVGLGQGYQPMCGFCYGAKLFNRVKAGFWFTTRVGTLFLLFWAVVLFIFSDEVIALFRDDPDVIEIGTLALRFQICTMPLVAICMASNMLTQTCRKTLRANFLAAARQGLFFIPLVIILPHYYGLMGLVISQPVADVLCTLSTIPIIWFTLKEMK